MPSAPPFKLFIIYAREDQPALLELKAHLRPLERRGDLTVWYDGEILPGQEWDKAIKEQLEIADIVLLFISSHFFNSDYIEREELKKVLERHHKGKVIIIPIIVSPCVWDASPEITDFQVLPKDAKPISIWKDSDEAWVDVARGVLRIIEQHGKISPNLDENDVISTSVSVGNLAHAMLKRTEESSSNRLNGIPSGFVSLDRLTSGWQQSELIIVAARPGMGKTSLMLSCALNAAKDFGKPVALFSLEMTSLQMTDRLISIETGIQSSKLRNGQLQDFEWQQLQSAIERISLVPIYIDDTPEINIFELSIRCRRLKTGYDIQLIIIDHLQLITSGSENSGSANPEQEVASITRALKNIAKELNVPVIVLSQLDRGVETRGGSKRPQLSDLQKLGSIEHYADIVAFLYRPEYYQILEDETGQNLKGVAEFIIAKHRNGSLETVKLNFTDTFAKFSDLDDSPLTYPFTPSVVTRGSRMTVEDIPF